VKKPFVFLGSICPEAFKYGKNILNNRNTSNNK